MNQSSRQTYQETLRSWFAEMLATAKNDPDWFYPWLTDYKAFCQRIKHSDRLSNDDIEELVFKVNNVISAAGQSILSQKLFDEMRKDRRFRKALLGFKRNPDIDHYDQFWNAWRDIAHQHGKPHRPLRINRVAVAFTNSVVNVPNEDDFYAILSWLINGGFVSLEPTNHWFADSKALARALGDSLSGSPGYDVWWRNVFPWWLKITKMKDSHSSETSSQTKSPHTMNNALNTILYGPPGTGKTHNIVNYVLNIIDGTPIPTKQTSEEYASAKRRFDELKSKGHIDFTTFHQSYGYEDFIEGIRPVLDEDNCEESNVQYELHEGVFKAFCKRALSNTETGTEDFGIRQNPSIWKISLQGTGDNPTRKDCLKNGYIRIGWDDYGPNITEETEYNSYPAGKKPLDYFINRMQKGDIVLSCFSSTTIDAIGVVTGDYEWHDEFGEYKRLRKVHWLVKNIREDIVDINHQRTLTLSTVYRLKIDLADILDIVRKYSPQGAALTNNTSPFVFVIDEINRGNISKIFGELITLAEPSKRLGAVEETKAKLPYSGDEFGVPSNVYILGTMNTADRSIALLDTALRRRFEFVEMMPNPDLLADIHVGDTGIDLKAMLQRMNDRIEFLLDREHTIGHAYFLGDFKDHPTLAGLAEIFRNKIVPLLQEYFFDDYSKIRLVLGDNGKKEIAVQFFNEKKPDDVFFGNAEDAVDPDRCVYRINKAAFGNPAAYIGIYDEKTV